MAGWDSGDEDGALREQGRDGVAWRLGDITGERLRSQPGAEGFPWEGPLPDGQAEAEGSARVWRGVAGSVREQIAMLLEDRRNRPPVGLRGAGAEDREGDTGDMSQEKEGQKGGSPGPVRRQANVRTPCLSPAELERAR